MTKQRPILFYDGDCLLCSRVVQWIIQNDEKGLIYFSTLENGRIAGIVGLQNDTVIFWYRQQMFQKSKAAAEVLKLVGGFYSIAGKIISIFPGFIADKFYDFVARNRYQWFGKKENCLIPRPEWSYRILSLEQLSSEVESL
jgi:predicted DCC family thiol-disulfide oxidoreductase YuxK